MEYSIINDSRLLKRFIIESGTLPPSKSYFFDPKEQIYNNNQIRMIYFGGQKFTDKEEESVNSMINILTSENSSILKEILPPFYNESKLRGVILQNQYENNFQLDKIKDNIYQQIKLRSNLLQLEFNLNSFQLLNDGHIFCFGRDKCFRPVIYAKFQDSENFLTSIKKEEIKIASMYLSLYIQNYMLLDGQVENCFLIIDLDSSTLSPSIRDFCQQLIYPIDLFYKYFLFKIIIVNSKNLEMKFKTKIQQTISHLCLNEIEFYTEKNPSVLNEYISKNQLLKEYGGNEIINQYWPPNIPNDEFEENISNMMQKEDYKNALINNDFMIPHPDMSKELRLLKHKRGNLPHKELIFKKHKEKRDSYNGIEEKVQLDSETFALMFHNSEINPGASSKNSSILLSEIESENRPIMTYTTNSVVLLNDLDIQFKHEIKNSQNQKKVKLNENFIQNNSIIDNKTININLLKINNENENQMVSNDKELNKELRRENLIQIQSNIISKKIHEKQTNPSQQNDLIFNTKFLLNSIEPQDLTKNQNNNPNQNISSFEIGENSKNKDSKKDEKFIDSHNINFIEEKKENSKEKIKNIMNLINTKQIYESEFIEDSNIKNGGLESKQKLESEPIFDCNNPSNSNRNKIGKEVIKSNVQLNLNSNEKNDLIQKQIQMGSEEKESKYSLYPPSSPCTISSPPLLDTKKFKPNFSKSSNTNESDSTKCKCFQNCC